VITGKSSERVKRFHHDELKVFGQGRGHSAGVWQSVFRQLLSLGYIYVDHDAFGAIKLEADAAAVFRREHTLMFRRDRPQRTSKAAKLRSLARDDLDATTRGTFERLRKLRLEIAREAGLAPYMVFNDATLVAMATSLPHDMLEMAAVPGLGTVKLQKYGEQFLEALRDTF
jgi:ATP-dependent DNA helicase RecQ